MALNPTITQEEMALLEWLGKEDSSAFGECHGKHLDSLKAKGLVVWDESLEPPQRKEYCRVMVTDLGWSMLRQARETIHPVA